MGLPSTIYLHYLKFVLQHQINANPEVDTEQLAEKWTSEIQEVR